MSEVNLPALRRLADEAQQIQDESRWTERAFRRIFYAATPRMGGVRCLTSIRIAGGVVRHGHPSWAFDALLRIHALRRHKAALSAVFALAALGRGTPPLLHGRRPVGPLDPALAGGANDKQPSTE